MVTFLWLIVLLAGVGAIVWGAEGKVSGTTISLDSIRSSKKPHFGVTGTCFLPAAPRFSGFSDRGPQNHGR
jgi:hypothetical protein